ncbi:MAG: hypothetical protein V1862_04575 [Methanobacteriota archaeon]
MRYISRVIGQDIVDTSGEIIRYLKEDWLRRNWVLVTDRLQDAITGAVWEIYVNAFEYSSSPFGVFSCGQHYLNNRELSLSIVDFRVSIPHNVRRYVQKYGR